MPRWQAGWPGSAEGPPRGLPGDEAGLGARWAVGAWTLQPAGLRGGSGCPCTTPRVVWFPEQPAVPRVPPAPPGILRVQPPGAGGQEPVFSRTWPRHLSLLCLSPVPLLGAPRPSPKALPSWEGCWPWGPLCLSLPSPTSVPDVLVTRRGHGSPVLWPSPTTPPPGHSAPLGGVPHISGSWTAPSPHNPSQQE